MLHVKFWFADNMLPVANIDVDMADVSSSDKLKSELTDKQTTPTFLNGETTDTVSSDSPTTPPAANNEGRSLIIYTLLCEISLHTGTGHQVLDFCSVFG